MFLAIKEIKYNKFRYTLIVSVLVLIAYLVFFLVGLANGLSEQNKTAITAWEADGIVLTRESNGNIDASIFEDDLLKEVQAYEVAPLLQFSTSVDVAEKLTGIRIFGVDTQSFIEPNILSGTLPKNLHEVVIDSYLSKKLDIDLGSTFQIINYETPLTVVGITTDKSLSVTPVVFSTMDTALDISKQKNTMNEEMYSAMPDILSAVVVRGDIDMIKVKDADLELYTIDDFINELPGYTAQNLTFSLMIFFLILIGAIVAGIFIYVLTMQKQQIFGVMKAQGISNYFIIKSVIIQTMLLSSTGVLIGLLLTIITQLFLPITVPFSLNISVLVGIAGIMIVCTTIAGMFSSRSIIKVDPLKALA